MPAEGVAGLEELGPGIYNDGHNWATECNWFKISKASEDRQVCFVHVWSCLTPWKYADQHNPHDRPVRREIGLNILNGGCFYLVRSSSQDIPSIIIRLTLRGWTHVFKSENVGGRYLIRDHVYLCRKHARSISPYQYVQYVSHPSLSLWKHRGAVFLSEHIRRFVPVI